MKYTKDRETTKAAFRAGRTYDLTTNQDMIQSLLINIMSWTDQDGVTFNNKDTSVSTYTENCNAYTVTYYPASEFKRATFSCTKVEHEPKTGRVSEMTFEQFK